MSHARFIIGDTRDVTATLADGSVDLVLTSPPFLALRSYLPADHPDKHREIGSEPTPAEFIDTLLELTAEWGRVLAPHGSIAIELGDTYSGAAPSGQMYDTITHGPDGARRGQAAASAGTNRRAAPKVGEGWPLAKSKALIPELYRTALAYGINPLTGQPSPAGRWRVRNVVTWCRPNPPVGALGDKYRPATSDMVIATRSANRWFDLDAVRVPPKSGPAGAERADPRQAGNGYRGVTDGGTGGIRLISDPAGAPPLDYWVIPPGGYEGAHYAVYPPELCRIPVESMCPREVCRQCGQPRRRITGDAEYVPSTNPGTSVSAPASQTWTSGVPNGRGAHSNKPDGGYVRSAPTLGWTDCGHGDGCTPTTWRTAIAPVIDEETGEPVLTKAGRPKMARQRVIDHLGHCADPSHWRRGVVFDPFVGSGTTLMVATGHGRDAIGVDLDHRNADLALERVGMFLSVEEHPVDAP